MRSGTVAMVNVAGGIFAESSSQESGVATVAPGRARSEYGATAVAPRVLRR